MTATYDPSLPTDKDWVRFFVGDMTATMTLSDEEILALLAEPEYPNKWLAAAAAGRRIQAKGKGALSKSVAELSLSRGAGAGTAYGDVIKSLQEQGAKFELGKDVNGTTGTHVFRFMGDL